MMFPEVGPARSVVVGYRMDAMTEEARQKALQAFELSMTRCPVDKAEELVVMLNVSTASRAEDTAGIAVKMAVYAQALSAMPLDVAKETVKHFAENGKWFPTVSELVAHGKTLINSREAMLCSLKSWKVIPDRQKQENALYEAYRAKNRLASELETKTGPGPATDTGPRGERIAAAKSAREEAQKAKQEWMAFKNSA